ncbi:hypothetical protein ACYJ1Y_11580 [Natrialbaceae archaeon A-gly3]
MAKRERSNIRDAERECASTNSFDDHGIDDGSELIRRAYYRIKGEEDVTFEPTERFFDRLEVAFIWAYLSSVEGNTVPEDVAVALADAKVITREEFRDRPDANLRTEVIPEFYRQTAGFHCAYR